MFPNHSVLETQLESLRHTANIPTVKVKTIEVKSESKFARLNSRPSWVFDLHNILKS